MAAEWRPGLLPRDVGRHAGDEGHHCSPAAVLSGGQGWRAVLNSIPVLPSAYFCQQCKNKFIRHHRVTLNLLDQSNNTVCEKKNVWSL